MRVCSLCEKALCGSLSRHLRAAHGLDETEIQEIVRSRKAAGGSAGTEAQRQQRVSASRAAGSLGGSARTDLQLRQRVAAKL